MRVLGFDPSLTHYGWAIHDTGLPLGSQCSTRGVLRTSPETLFLFRYRYLKASLITLMSDVRPDRVAIEVPYFHDTWSEGMYGVFLFACDAMYESGQSVVFLGNKQTKAFATQELCRPEGWKSDKLDLKELSKKVGGKGRWSDHESDAYIAALLGARFWGLLEGQITESCLGKYERHLFLNIDAPKKGPRAGKIFKTGLIYCEGTKFFRWSKDD